MDQIGRVLITGSGGRLGRLLRAAFKRSPCPETEVVFQSRSPGLDIHWSPGDPISALPGCDMVVALWGRTDGDERALAENSDLVDLCVAVARHSGARRVVHMSSAAVYGPGKALSETAVPAPTNAYGAAKCAMERRVAETSDKDALDHSVLRLANVVGADSLAPALVGDGPVFLDRFDDGGGPARSYLAAGDFARLICALNRCKRPPALLNVASASSIRMEDLARAAGKRIVWRPAPATAVQNVTLDISKLIAAFPDLSPRETAQELVADWRALERAA